MNKRNIAVAGGAAALGLFLIALPGHSNTQQQVKKEKKVIILQSPDNAEPAAPQEPSAAPDVIFTPGTPAPEAFAVSFDGEGSSWLGVETQEVNSDKVKAFKLPAERGVVVGKVLNDSPAAKAGLKENDVILEINGQRVEGTAQFRRMVREIPAGRSAQLTLWRNGSQQSLSVTLGKAEEGRRTWVQAAPQAFAFKMPEMPEMPALAPAPDMPALEWDGDAFLSSRPRLGIDAEDLSGKLGTYFGAPDGEAVLVRDVNAESPAEKAGIQAGDVITTVNGNRVRTVGELREQLSAASSTKSDSTKENATQSVKIGILRNKTSMTVTAEIPSSTVKFKRRISQRTKI